MLEFTVQDMTCGHCVATITKAVQQLDAGARVDADVQSHLVRVAGAADPQAVEDAIRAAGYTPQRRG